MLKKILITALLIQLSAMVVFAQQDKTLLISESGLPYTAQTWFAYGSEDIDQKDIVGCWDQGKRIVTAAYTGEGWFVIMAGNTPYSMQTYLASDQWPEEWIAKKTQEGYAITSMSRSNKQWRYGYSITDLAFDGKQWLVVMSQNSKFVSQGYFISDTTNDMMRSIQSEVWNKGFNLHQVAYGGGKYIVTFGNYAYGDERFQNLQVCPDDPKEYIRQQWERGICIAYIGGGLVSRSKR